MPTQIQLRRGTAAEWTSANPVLAQGEIGLETDTNQFKMGDGTSTWTALSYGGVKGPTGPTGPTNSLSIGTVTTGSPGSTGAASITGPAPTQTLNLTVPQGPTGPATTISIGTVTTGLPASSAAASVTGPAGNQSLSLTIPQGPTGAAGITLSINAQASTYTLVLSDQDKLIEMSGGGTLAVPDTSVAFPIGAQINVLQTGASQVTIAATGPTAPTVNATPGLKLRTQWSSATLIKRASNTWVAIGDLTA